MTKAELKAKTNGVILDVLITEKGSQLSVNNQYVLEVAADATKPQIAEAAEKKFGVHVLAVRTANMKGGLKYIRGTRRATVEPTWKKAVVTVKAGERIERAYGVRRLWHLRITRPVRAACVSASPPRSRRSPKRAR